MDKLALQQKILAWYEKNKRDLPWRRTTNPYHIMVSEIMLQQTQVDRVIPKYEAFLQAFPTIWDLAEAPTSQVLELWSGLGYNSRAIRLQEAAKIICKRYDGQIPKSRDALLDLPGIGPYTANAILSFAHNLPHPCIDTNIRRIILHELKLSEKTSPAKLYAIAESLIPENRSRDWHNALMDYGSSILTSRKTGIKPLTTQSKFLHSKRWYRGQILKLLIKEKETTYKELITQFKKTTEEIVTIVQEMEKEKLVSVENERITLPMELGRKLFKVSFRYVNNEIRI